MLWKDTMNEHSKNCKFAKMPAWRSCSRAHRVQITEYAQSTDGISVCGIPSCPKLKRVPEGEVRLGENGELLAESCSPLVEWERSQSRLSSWPRSCGDGPYLRKVKEKVKGNEKIRLIKFYFIFELKWDDFKWRTGFIFPLREPD